MAGLKVACLVLVIMCMAVVGAPVAQAITCGQVTGYLATCLTYLEKGGAPLPSCCAGVRNVLAAARTTADRQTVCNCLKSTAGSMSSLNPKFAELLPSQCKVNIPYKISTSTNCASIKF